MNFWTKVVEVNVGRVERYARTFCGVALVAAALFVPTSWGMLGLYPLLTGVFGTDPLYLLLGIKTTPKRGLAKPPRPLPRIGNAS